MIFETGTIHLQSVWEVLHGQVNDVVICRELNTMRKSFYTLWIVKDHRSARMLLTMFEEQGKEDGQAYLECFPMGESLCFTFPYYTERPLLLFYSNTVMSGNSRTIIWLNYVKACMTVRIPYPVLYLLIEQGQVQLGEEGSIHFNYSIDMAELDKSKQSAACVGICAEKLLPLFAEEQDKNFRGYELLFSKLGKHQYTEFTQLYRDVLLVIHTQERMPWSRRLHQSIQKKRDPLYHVLVVIGMFLLAVVFIITVSQIVYGEIPLFRIFQPLFRTIGTESLVR